eukprot:g1046.t1
MVLQISSHITAQQLQGGEEEAKQHRLARGLAKQAAIPFGRGAFTLGALKALGATDVVGIPQVNFSAIFPNDATLREQQGGRMPAQIPTVFPDPGLYAAERHCWVWFANGVASALQIDNLRVGRSWLLHHRVLAYQTAKEDGDEIITDAAAARLDRATVASSSFAIAGADGGSPTAPPPNPLVGKNSHAGFLLGLGVRGLLSHETLPTADCYKYLKLQHEATTISVLLGLAASAVGRMPPAATRMCALHIPGQFAFEAPATVRAAASVGLGLLYASSGQKGMAELLAKELESRNECQQLAAAFGIGLVCLGCRTGGLSFLEATNVAGFGRSEVVEHHGGLELSTAAPHLFGSSSARALANTRLQHRRSTRRNASSHNTNFTEEETELIAPLPELKQPCNHAVCIALALVHLQSNDRIVAERVPIPKNAYQLAGCRPDLLVCRLIARNLVLWDGIEASERWLASQVPLFVRGLAREMLLQWAIPMVQQGPGDGSGNLNAVHVPLSGEKDSPAAFLGLSGLFLRGTVLTEGCEEATAAPGVNKRDLDWLLLSQTLCYAIASGCYILGLRFAGAGATSAAESNAQEPIATAASAAKKIIIGCLRKFLQLHRKQPTSFASGTVLSGVLDLHSLHACQNMCVIALGMVMAGSGDLESFTLLRSIRKRADLEKSNFGTFLAVHMAIGLLFLGGCKYGFSTSARTGSSSSRLQVAALLIGLYPKFPASKATAMMAMAKAALQIFIRSSAYPNIMAGRGAIPDEDEGSSDVEIIGESQPALRRLPGAGNLAGKGQSGNGVQKPAEPREVAKSQSESRGAKSFLPTEEPRCARITRWWPIHQHGLAAAPALEKVYSVREIYFKYAGPCTLRIGDEVSYKSVEVDADSGELSLKEIEPKLITVSNSRSTKLGAVERHEMERALENERLRRGDRSGTSGGGTRHTGGSNRYVRTEKTNLTGFVKFWSVEKGMGYLEGPQIYRKYRCDLYCRQDSFLSGESVPSQGEKVFISEVERNRGSRDHTASKVAFISRSREIKKRTAAHRQEATVVRWFADEGFGFLESDDIVEKHGQPVFFHVDDMDVSDGLVAGSNVQAGTLVLYDEIVVDMSSGEGVPKAVGVRVRLAAGGAIASRAGAGASTQLKIGAGPASRRGAAAGSAEGGAVDVGGADKQSEAAEDELSGRRGGKAEGGGGKSSSGQGPPIITPGMNNMVPLPFPQPLMPFPAAMALGQPIVPPPSAVSQSDPTHADGQQHFAQQEAGSRLLSMTSKAVPKIAGPPALQNPFLSSSGPPGGEHSSAAKEHTRLPEQITQPRSMPKPDPPDEKAQLKKLPKTLPPTEPPTKDCKKLEFSNIPETAAADLCIAFFRKAGKLTDFRFFLQAGQGNAKSKKHLGKGLITYATQEQAKTAMHKLNNKVICEGFEPVVLKWFAGT